MGKDEKTMHERYYKHLKEGDHFYEKGVWYVKETRNIAYRLDKPLIKMAVHELYPVLTDWR